jgi:hypothetical protein
MIVEDIPIWVAIMFGLMATTPWSLGVAIFNVSLSSSYWKTLDGKTWPKKREWVFDREKYWFPAGFVIIWFMATLLLEIYS